MCCYWSVLKAQKHDHHTAYSAIHIIVCLWCCCLRRTGSSYCRRRRHVVEIVALWTMRSCRAAIIPCIRFLSCLHIFFVLHSHIVLASSFVIRNAYLVCLTVFADSFVFSYDIVFYLRSVCVCIPLGSFEYTHTVAATTTIVSSI